MSIEKIIRNAAFTIAAIYASVILLFSFPAMQSRLANWIADVLSEQLDTKVSIRSVSVGLLNRLIINDIGINDRNGGQMLSVARMSVSVNYLSFLVNEIDIPAAQLYGARALVYRNTPDSPLNIQFVIDALSSKDPKKDSSMSLRLNSLVVRHAYVKYDVRSELRQKKLDVNHINIHDAGFNLSIKALTEDSVNVRLRRFSSTEKNSGLAIRSLNVSVEGNRNNLWLRELSMAMPQSTITVDGLHLKHQDYDFALPFSVDSVIISASLCPSDFAPLLPALQTIDKRIQLTACISGNEKGGGIKGLSVSTDNGATSVRSDVYVDFQKDSVGKYMLAAVSVPNLSVSSSSMSLASILREVKIDSATARPILNAGDIEIHSSLYANKIAGKDFSVQADATVNTGVGGLACVAELSAGKELDVMLQKLDLNLGKLFGNDNLGQFTAKASATLQLETKHELPVGNLIADIANFEYNGYSYKGMSATAKSTGGNAVITFNTEDPNADIDADIDISKNGNLLSVISDVDINCLNPNALNLTDKFPKEDFSCKLSCDLSGSNLDNLKGTFLVEDFIASTPDSTYALSHINITAKESRVLLDEDKAEQSTTTTYTITSDFMDAELEGVLQPSQIPAFITNTISHNLSTLVSGKDVDIKTLDCAFHATVRDSRLIRHLTGVDCVLSEPVNVAGSMDSEGKSMSVNLTAPSIILSGTDYRDIDLRCNATNDSITLNGLLSRVTEEDRADAKVHACGIDNNIATILDFELNGDHKIKVNTNASVQFADSLGKLLTDVNFKHSTVNIDNTDWTATPSSVTVYDEDIVCRNFRVQHDDSYIIIDGKASPNNNDSLLVNLSKIDVEYVLNLINFHAVDFGGLASGKAVVRNIFGKPDLLAHLDVRGFKFQGGCLGNAGIDAKWNKRTHGIELNAIFTDDFQVCTGADGKTLENVIGLTNLIGYVSPEEESLDLRLQTNRTNIEFLNGFLDGVFTNINGYISGPVSVVGPFSEVNVIGEADATLSATLLSTKVTYHMENQRVKMSDGLFDFPSILLTDKYGRELAVNGRMTHCGFSDIDFDFNARANNVLCYEEHGFNSDHFYGTIFGSGNISINGVHDRPIYIDANITTEPNSVFAYDAWTPESGGNSSFITFRDKSALSDSAETPADDRQNYNSMSDDMYINCNLNMNNNCKVMLRLDNTSEEGYITVRGNSPLQIKYYNKGAFEMFGNYDIESGNYRLYLQNPIYKDLAIQSGSSASFNGNPFNAKVHLNCKHTINSVPLSDLTVSTGTGQRNDVRVECLLDITGNLSKLDLDFDLNLPTASDETRQLVNSMINTDEEMNRQIIYLLAIGRFYPNEYARANSTSNNSSSAAVSSFVSSTISGQINNMLGSLMGNNSNWNVGAGISAGERGWEDMGVEGSLSGRLFNDRLLINGVFGYRDNARTNTASFIGDFEVKWRLKKDGGNMYLKAYNQTNDRYFTKSTINTQGIGINYQHDFDDWRHMFRKPLLKQ